MITGESGLVTDHRTILGRVETPWSLVTDHRTILVKVYRPLGH